MEQTLLERKLEKFLQEIGMPLGERYYVDAMQMQAELEDIANPKLKELNKPIKDLNEFWDQVIAEEESGESSEHGMIRMGLEPSFQRRSEIYNGLGFEYTLDACLEQRRYGREKLDELIRKRDFTTIGGEFVSINYNKDFQWQEPISTRAREQFYHRFYSIERPVIMNISINEKGIIHIIDDFSEIGLSELDYKRLQPSLQRIHAFKDSSLLNEPNIYRLMDSLREIKEVV